MTAYEHRAEESYAYKHKRQLEVVLIVQLTTSSILSDAVIAQIGSIVPWKYTSDTSISFTAN